jgi:hypothetical protein
MGCGGSKDSLEKFEKPLCHKMEKYFLENIDSVFEKCSPFIQNVEEKRKLLIDDLMDIYYQTGAWVYKNPDPQKALECAVWRLGVDNNGIISDIGLNLKTLRFEGNSNSGKGNSAANYLITSMKYLTNKWKIEDFTQISNQLNEFLNEISGNMEKYEIEINEMELKISYLRQNLEKCKRAYACIKDLIVKMKELIECAPTIIINCDPSKFLNHQPNVQKAFEANLFENLDIAFFIVDPKHRRGKTCKAVEDDYSLRLKMRNEILAKIHS